jgi:hypothetical protein
MVKQVEKVCKPAAVETDFFIRARSICPGAYAPDALQPKRLIVQT